MMKKVLSFIMILSLLAASCLLFTSCDKTGVKDFEKNAASSLEDAYANATEDFFVLDRSLGTVVNKVSKCGSLGILFESDILDPVAKIGETVYIDAENGKYVSDTLVNYGGEDLVLRAYLDRQGIGLSAASLFGEGTYLLNFASFREGFATSTMAELFARGDAETVAEITEAVGELEKMLDAALTKTEAANDALKNEMLSLLAIKNETGTKKVGDTEFSCVVTTMSLTNATLRAYLAKSADAVTDTADKAALLESYDELMDEIDDAFTMSLTAKYYTDVKANKLVAFTVEGSLTAKEDDIELFADTDDTATIALECVFAADKISLAATVTVDGDTASLTLDLAKAVNGATTTYTLSGKYNTPSVQADLLNLTLSYNKDTGALALSGDVMESETSRMTLSLSGTLTVTDTSATLEFTSLTLGEESYTFRFAVTATALDSIPALPADAKDVVNMTEGNWVDLLNSLMESPLGALFGGAQ